MLLSKYSFSERKPASFGYFYSPSTGKVNPQKSPIPPQKVTDVLDNIDIKASTNTKKQGKAIANIYKINPWVATGILGGAAMTGIGTLGALALRNRKKSELKK